MIDVDKLVEKIMAGMSEMTKEDLQFYVNNSKEIERRLHEIKELNGELNES